MACFLALFFFSRRVTSTDLVYGCVYVSRTGKQFCFFDSDKFWRRPRSSGSNQGRHFINFFSDLSADVLICRQMIASPGFLISSEIYMRSTRRFCLPRLSSLRRVSRKSSPGAIKLSSKFNSVYLTSLTKRGIIIIIIIDHFLNERKSGYELRPQSFLGSFGGTEQR